MKLYWTQEAIDKLEALRNYIAIHNQQAAEQEITRIIMRSRQLLALPELGREVPEYQRPDIREILERPYRIIYQLRQENIAILSVMHYRQLLPSDLKEFLDQQP